MSAWTQSGGSPTCPTSRTRCGRPTSTCAPCVSGRSSPRGGTARPPGRRRAAAGGRRRALPRPRTPWSARALAQAWRPASSWAPSPRHSASRATALLRRPSRAAAPADDRFGQTARASPRSACSSCPRRRRAPRADRRALDRRRPGGALVSRTVVVLGAGARAGLLEELGCARTEQRWLDSAAATAADDRRASGGARWRPSSAKAPRSTSPATRTRAPNGGLRHRHATPGGTRRCAGPWPRSAGSSRAASTIG